MPAALSWATHRVVRRRRAAGRVYCSEPLESRLLLIALPPIVVTNTNDSGAGSLRQAILESNDPRLGNRNITFNIPGGGVHTIVPLSAFPAVTRPTAIEGDTQPGYAGTPLIEIDGAFAGLLIGVNGLDITAGSTSVSGLIVNRFSGNGIVLETAGGDTVQNCFIGTNAAGTFALGNAFNGILISTSGDTIGGTAAGDANVISANAQNGILLTGPSAASNVVTANVIGVGANGRTAIGNHGAGVLIQDAVSNTIGPGNTIANNGGTGVAIVGAATRNFVTGNSIFSNSHLGIDLGNDGVTPNDPGDVDSGPNGLQNFPVLAGASSSAGGTTVGGTLNGIKFATYRIEIFYNSSADPSGYGQGRQYLGTTSVTADQNGNATFGLTVATSVPVGGFVTATATDPNNNTSEFCAAVIVTSVGQLAATSGTPALNTDLTALGTRDWAHWGLTTVTDFDHKTSATEHISNLTGTVNPGWVGEDPQFFSWSDGTPHTVVDRTASGIDTDDAEITAPADGGITRVLKLFVAAYANAQLTAHFTDYSTPVLDVAFSATGYTEAVYTITYRSAGVSASPRLVVDWSAFGAQIQAAALETAGDFPAPSHLTAAGCMPGTIQLRWLDNTDSETGFGIEQATVGGTFVQVATVPADTTTYTITGLDPTQAYQFRVRALGTIPSAYSSIAILSAAGNPPSVDQSHGFAGETALVLNGSARITGPSEAPANALELTPAQFWQVGSAFTSVEHDIGAFDTSFDFIQPTADADGFTFTLQNGDPTAIGVMGGSLGYANVPNSAAVKFDLYPSLSTTGLYSGGAQPIEDSNAIDMSSAGINLHNGLLFHVHLLYDGTTLHETVSDLASGATFTHNYAADLPARIGSRCAFVGFTGATGGALAKQDIVNWTFKSLGPVSNTINGTAGNDSIYIKQDPEGVFDDVWLNSAAAPSGAPTQLAVISAPIVVNSAGGLDTLTLDSSAGSPMPPALTLNGSFTLPNPLSIGAGQEVILAHSTGGAALLDLQGLAIDPAGKLNLQNNAVRVHYSGNSPMATIAAYVHSGYNAGTWDGNGIQSTDANSQLSYAIGYADSADGVVAGLAAGMILVRYTRIGDVNLDGSVGFADLLLLAQHYGSSAAAWDQGDLNQDGTVAFADLLALAQNYGGAVATVAPSASFDPLRLRLINRRLFDRPRSRAELLSGSALS